MEINVSLVGLGQIGTSIGLALEDYTGSIHRFGYDRDQDVAAQAKEIGAVDQVLESLPASVEKADIVLLALPLHQIRSAFEAMSGGLKRGALVIDTAPIKRSVKVWADELLPDGVRYVGFTPVINPEYLHEEQFGIQAARKDLFEGGMIAVVTGKRAGEDVVKMATNLIGFLGAEPFFVDAAEIDGLMTMTYIMPRVLAASLLNATLSKPGWRDGRKVAGRAYARVSGPLTPVDEPASLANIVMNNKDNVIRVMGDVIDTLRKFRQDVEEGNEASLLSMLEKVQKGRDAWWRDRQTSSWAEHEDPRDSPGGNVLKQLFGFGFTKPPTGDEEW